MDWAWLTKKPRDIDFAPGDSIQVVSWLNECKGNATVLQDTIPTVTVSWLSMSKSACAITLSLGRVYIWWSQSLGDLSYCSELQVASLHIPWACTISWILAAYLGRHGSHCIEINVQRGMELKRLGSDSHRILTQNLSSSCCWSAERCAMGRKKHISRPYIWSELWYCTCSWEDGSILCYTVNRKDAWSRKKASWKKAVLYQQK